MHKPAQPAAASVPHGSSFSPSAVSFCNITRHLRSDCFSFWSPEKYSVASMLVHPPSSHPFNPLCTNRCSVQLLRAEPWEALYQIEHCSSPESLAAPAQESPSSRRDSLWDGGREDLSWHKTQTSCIAVCLAKYNQLGLYDNNQSPA